ncbi:Thiol:disulfide interchange protein DsbA [Dyella sp. AD56]|uniref:thiol:disulfide interchange protein DsbA/DsbL n=1 Tax=Dyella sp. AD56 TaxID=1528744 RepID=UPI000C85DB81|nr:thiol:disulfide interchange protein DsbA/DsbL [Dyella sp. AD56]PMQ04700.1 Thiol:disulfide interchange protein DsbA [Dyella sp. AD56]
MTQHEDETMVSTLSAAPVATQISMAAAVRKRTSFASSAFASVVCRLMVLLLCMAAPMVASADTPFVPMPDKDYVVLSKPVLVSQDPGIEVVQVFSYACHACAKFEPQMSAWLLRRPQDVRFVYVPAVFGGAFDSAAKAYYAASELGVVAKTHEGIYRAVHVDGTLTSDSLDGIAAAYARLGVDSESFRRAYQGNSVAERVQWAHSYAKDAEVSSTPTLIVAGKYRVAMGRDESGDKVLATVDYLIDMERNKRSGH